MVCLSPEFIGGSYHEHPVLDLCPLLLGYDRDKWTFFEFYLACELGMTVSRLRTELTDAELVYFAAFYEIKNEEQEKAMDRAKMKQR